jgi:pimeloyl-ACP methyl ester carboxylesterase
MMIKGTFRTADGVELAFSTEGEGKPVLALAGLTRDGRDFDYVAPHLQGVRLIRLDSRGRGHSGWAAPQTYSVPQEAADALALLDHLGLERAGILGSSRGGLIGMFIAATAKARLAGLCLNDVGPVLERAGLERIGQYVGIAPLARSLDEIAAGLALTMQGFDGVQASRWKQEAERHFTVTADGIGLTYDPALRDGFIAAMNAPAVDLWPLFDACADLPLALMRGANSDLLGANAAGDMLARRPDMVFAEVPDRGHIPFLDEPEAVSVIRRWIDRL